MNQTSKFPRIIRSQFITRMILLFDIEWTESVGGFDSRTNFLSASPYEELFAYFKLFRPLFLSWRHNSWCSEWFRYRDFEISSKVSIECDEFKYERFKSKTGSDSEEYFERRFSLCSLLSSAFSEYLGKAIVPVLIRAAD